MASSLGALESALAKSPAVRAFASALLSIVRAKDEPCSVLLTGPADPDGDSIGAGLGLGFALQQLGVNVTVSGTPAFRYSWLPGASAMVPDGDVQGPFDVVVVLDGDRHRLHPTTAVEFARAGHRVLLDHHRSTRPVGYDLSLIVPEAASTCELVIDVIDCWDVVVEERCATALYTGIVFDTGGFRHANTRPATLRTAARLVEVGIDHSRITNRVLFVRQPSGIRLLGQALSTVTISDGVAWAAISLADIARCNGHYTDLEGVVDQLLLTYGVELACLIIEREPGRVKLSFRSNSDFDVSALAQSLDSDGGGHRRAAGVELWAPFDRVVAEVPPVLVDAITSAG